MVWIPGARTLATLTARVQQPGMLPMNPLISAQSSRRPGSAAPAPVGMWIPLWKSTLECLSAWTARASTARRAPLPSWPTPTKDPSGQPACAFETAPIHPPMTPETTASCRTSKHHFRRVSATRAERIVRASTAACRSTEQRPPQPSIPSAQGRPAQPVDGGRWPRVRGKAERLTSSVRGLDGPCGSGQVWHRPPP